MSQQQNYTRNYSTSPSQSPMYNRNFNYKPQGHNRHFNNHAQDQFPQQKDQTQNFNQLTPTQNQNSNTPQHLDFNRYNPQNQINAQNAHTDSP